MRKRFWLPAVAVCCALAYYKVAHSQAPEPPKASAPATREFTMVNLEYEKSKIWLPSTLIAKKGERIKLTLINNTPSGVHGFAIDEFNVKANVEKGKKEVLEFVADKAGLFRIYCQLHPAHVGGQLLVLE